VPGLFDFLMGRGQGLPMPPMVTGINPDAPTPPQPTFGLETTGMAGQGTQYGEMGQRFNDAFNSPLFHIGIGLLGQGQLGPGIQQGLLSYNNNRTANERRGLLALQQQQLMAGQQELARKRQQAAHLRASLPSNSPLAALPDEQLISTVATVMAREPPKPINVNGKLVDPNDPTKVIADYSQTPEQLAAIERAKALATAGINEPLVQVPDPTSETGFRNVPRSQAVGKPALGPQGLALEFGPDGRPTGIRMGAGVTGKPGNPAGLAPKTLGDLDEQALAASNALARLDQIGRGFRPEYQQFATRGINWWNATKEKFGANLPEAERRQLAEFTSFKRDSVQNLNQTIKDITGAAMSVPEAERIKSQVPDAGTTVFNGDSPTEFKAKLEGATKDLRNALLRANWARTKGLDPLKTGVELSEVPALINKRGAEIAAEVKKQAPQLDDQAVRQLVRQRLGREFGMLQ
jgi:hypothetical protein